MLRYIMLVGREKLSLTLGIGTTIGKPPACQMPRFTSSIRCGKCAWQVLKSDQVDKIAMTGLSR